MNRHFVPPSVSRAEFVDRRSRRSILTIALSVLTSVSAATIVAADEVSFSMNGIWEGGLIEAQPPKGSSTESSSNGVSGEARSPHEAPTDLAQRVPFEDMLRQPLAPHAVVGFPTVGLPAAEAKANVVVRPGVIPEQSGGDDSLAGTDKAGTVSGTTPAARKMFLSRSSEDRETIQNRRDLAEGDGLVQRVLIDALEGEAVGRGGVVVRPASTPLARSVNFQSPGIENVPPPIGQPMQAGAGQPPPPLTDGSAPFELGQDNDASLLQRFRQNLGLGPGPAGPNAVSPNAAGPNPVGPNPVGPNAAGNPYGGLNAGSIGDAISAGGIVEGGSILEEPVVGSAFPSDPSLGYGSPAFYGDGSRFSMSGHESRIARSRLVGAMRRTRDAVRSTQQRVDAGLGAVLVPDALVILDTTQPLKQYRVRGDFGYGLDFPDRGEYFAASPLMGPGYRGPIDYQEFAFMFETGNDSASVQTEFPVRGWDGDFGGGHAGFGDIRVTQKLKLLDGTRWQITQLLRVFTPTGNAGLGNGTGHASMEPGVAFRWQQDCWTYWHANLKYRIPIGGDPVYTGDVLEYGFGVSSVWYESLSSAIIPTLEFTSINFLNGSKTGPVPPFGVFGPQNVDGESAISLHPGIRYAWDPGGDFGVVEIGVSSGFAISSARHFDQLVRLELRFSR